MTLGATVSNLLILLSRDVAVQVGVGILVAWPVTYLLMNRWLEQFAYRIDLGPGLFLVGAAVASALAMFTVSWQTIRAALGNPVDSLRYE